MLAARILLLVATTMAANVIQFYINPSQKTVPTYVQQLVEGSIERIEQGSRLTASVSLVFDGGYYIMVDTPSATDFKAKETMLRGVASRNIVPGEVQLVVTTHGHPDHFGQGNFFPNARHFFGSYEYADDNYISTELKTNSSMRLTSNVELWNTPGHTSQDVSVIVHNVPCCGTVAVVGDLFYHEQDALNGTEWFGDAWNPLIGKVNRDKVLCYANYIIPGHGKIFKVTEEMKRNATCGIPLPPIDLDYNGLLPSSYAAPSSVVPSLSYTPYSATTSTTSTTTVTPPTTQAYVQKFTFTAAPRTTTTTVTEPVTTTEEPQTTTSTPFLITVEDLLETPPPEMTNLVQSVNDALPYMMSNVVEPAAKELHQLAEQPSTNHNLIAPVVESAAMQLSRLLRVNLDIPPRNQYPFTNFWKDTINKIANDVPQLKQVFSSLPRGTAAKIVNAPMQMARLAQPTRINPATNTNYLNTIRKYQPR